MRASNEMGLREPDAWPEVTQLLEDGMRTGTPAARFPVMQVSVPFIINCAALHLDGGQARVRVKRCFLDSSESPLGIFPTQIYLSEAEFWGVRTKPQECVLPENFLMHFWCPAPFSFVQPCVRTWF